LIREDARIDAFAPEAVARRPANVSSPTPVPAIPIVPNATSATSRTGVVVNSGPS
jgi:hypothetical protein